MSTYFGYRCLGCGYCSKSWVRRNPRMLELLLDIANEIDDENYSDYRIGVDPTYSSFDPPLFLAEHNGCKGQCVIIDEYTRDLVLSKVTQTEY